MHLVKSKLVGQKIFKNRIHELTHTALPEGDGKKMIPEHMKADSESVMAPVCHTAAVTHPWIAARARPKAVWQTVESIMKRQCLRSRGRNNNGRYSS